MQFKIFNVQLLPLNSANGGDAGALRYLKLFEKLDEHVTNLIKEKRLLTDAMPLVNDSFFAPLNNQKIILNDQRNFIVGQFIKFHKAGEVEDLYTKATLFKAQRGQDAVANRKDFLFVFDPVSHWIGIEDKNGRLPNHKSIVSALERFLSPVANEQFPDYTVTVNLVSRNDELTAVLERAVGFTKIDVDITFKNGPTQDEVLQDMAANRLHRLKISASSDRGSHMPKIPDTIAGFVKNAPQYGQASITYLEQGKNGTTTMARYESESNPLLINVRSKREEEGASFFERIVDKLKALAVRTGHLEE